MTFRRLVPCVIAALSLVPALAAAQPLGTFRWQLQPFCNVVSLSIVQAGALYQLQGTDDQCGGATSAAATGLAFVNPDGTLGFGLSIVTSPGGAPLTVDANVVLPNASGTWRDSAGRTGALTFLPPGTPASGGAPRPLSSLLSAVQALQQQVTGLQQQVTALQQADAALVASDAVIPSGRTVVGTFSIPAAARGTIFTHMVALPNRAPVPLTDLAVNFAPPAGNNIVDADATCTGSYTAPTAPRGKVCIYRFAYAGTLSFVQGEASFPLPDRSFSITWLQPSGMVTEMRGVWAYTAP